MKKVLLLIFSAYAISAATELFILNYIATYNPSISRIREFADEARSEIARRYVPSERWSSSENYCREYRDTAFTYNLCATPRYNPSCAAPTLAIGLVPQKPRLTPEPLIGVDRLWALSRPLVRLDPDNNVCP